MFEWIGTQKIKDIEGALKPSAYVARAYRQAQKNDGRPPKWARKLGNGRWVFDIEYIKTDAKENLESISVSDAARVLGVTRRAVQTWVDEGEIPVVDGYRKGKGESRRILREEFMRNLPRLRMRLETPAVVGYKRKHGKPLSKDLIDRIEAERVVRQAAAKETDRARRREERKALRAVKLKAGRGKTAAAVEARLKEAREGRLKEESQAGLKAAAQVQLKKAREAELRKTREKAAAAVEAQLKEAKWEKHAAGIAERIIDDMFDNELSRVNAMILFNQIAVSHGIPSDIMMKVRKKFFGKRGIRK